MFEQCVLRNVFSEQNSYLGLQAYCSSQRLIHLHALQKYRAQQSECTILKLPILHSIFKYKIAHLLIVKRFVGSRFQLLMLRANHEKPLASFQTSTKLIRTHYRVSLFLQNQQAGPCCLNQSSRLQIKTNLVAEQILAKFLAQRSLDELPI